MSFDDFTLRAEDGTQLFARSRIPRDSPIAHILIYHGYGEHLGRYAEVMEWFSEAGWASWAVDFRGHGRSTGHRAYVERYDHYLQDAKALVDHVEKTNTGSLPVFLIGHSQGGLIALRSIQEGVGTFNGAVLSAPAMRVAIEANPVKVAAGKVLSRILPKLNLPPEIPNDYLCRDEERVALYSSDPLVNHCVNCRWFTEFLKAQDTGFLKASSVGLPTLVLHPTADGIISPDSVKELYSKLGSADKELAVLEGYYHEPFNEPERREVFDSVLAWCTKRLP